MSDVSLSEVARRLEVSLATLRRWVKDGIVPLPNGRWTPAAVAHARLAPRLRARGHSIEELRHASETGRLAYGYMEDLFPASEGEYSLQEAAEETGLEPALIERVFAAIGT